jgi:peptide/nickel transport system permease protein
MGGSPLIGYVIRRIVLLAPILLGMTGISFTVSRAIPTDPVVATLGQQAAEHPAIVAAYRQHWGLDKPLPLQYVLYVKNLLRGDLGESIYSHRPVIQDLESYLPATIELATITVLFSICISVPLGIIAAVRRGTFLDFAVRILTLVGVAMPIFWLALAALNLFYLQLGIAPAPGRLDASDTPPPTITGMYTVDSLLTANWHTLYDAISHLILPAMILATWSSGTLTRMTRTSMLSILPQDFLQAVRSKGARERHTILRHAVPNALVPVVTIVGLAYGDLLTGVILIETLFAWPGIGHYAYSAAIYADFPAIIGVTLVFGIVYTVVNLGVDVMYAVLDPRIRLAMASGRR